MRDGVLLRSLKRAARLGFEIELSVRRAFLRRRGQFPFDLGGECRRCARCCEAPAIQSGRAVWYVPALRSAFLWWQRRVNGFELTGRHAGNRVFVFKCSHFDWQTRSCDSYDSRPGICRDYPRVLLAQARPEMLEGCGYRPLARNRAELGAALAGAGLAGDSLRKARKDLFVE